MWWNDIYAGSEAYAPVVINTNQQTDYLFTSQSWHGDGTPYNQQHVRAGMIANGYWVINVETPGRYQVELRRWPRELDLPMSARVERPDFQGGRLDPGTRLYKMDSQALDIIAARFKTQAGEQKQTVLADTRAVTFTVDLKAGEQKIQSWFELADGKSLGAYYVYLEPLK